MTNQELLFELIRRGSFNDFDGPKVAAELEKNADLWEAVVPSDGHRGSMLLRDLPDDVHLSTLWIRSSGRDDKKLVRLMKRLKADEVDWADEQKDDSASGYNVGFWQFKLHVRGKRVLRCWWD